MDAVRSAIREGVAGVLHALAEWIAPEEEWDEDTDDEEEWDDEPEEVEPETEPTDEGEAYARPVAGWVGMSNRRRSCCER